MVVDNKILRLNLGKKQIINLAGNIYTIKLWSKKEKHVQAHSYRETYRVFKTCRQPSPQKWIIGHMPGVWNNKRQLFYVQRQHLTILFENCPNINNVTHVCVNPKVPRVYSLQAIPAKGARLRPKTPESRSNIVMPNND